MIYLRNHGLFALGSTAAQVQQVTAMAAKVARVIQTGLSLGNLVYLPDHEAHRIDTGPDKDLRRSLLGAVRGRG